MTNVSRCGLGPPGARAGTVCCGSCPQVALGSGVGQVCPDVGLCYAPVSVCTCELTCLQCRVLPALPSMGLCESWHSSAPGGRARAPCLHDRLSPSSGALVASLAGWCRAQGCGCPRGSHPQMTADMNFGSTSLFHFKVNTKSWTLFQKSACLELLGHFMCVSRPPLHCQGPLCVLSSLQSLAEWLLPPLVGGLHTLSPWVRWGWVCFWPGWADPAPCWERGSGLREGGDRGRGPGPAEGVALPEVWSGVAGGWPGWMRGVRSGHQGLWLWVHCQLFLPSGKPREASVVD